MNVFTIALGIIAGIVQLAGYWYYNNGLKEKEINPNIISWFIWGIGSFIAVLIFSDMANDWVKEFLPIMCSIAAFATFMHMAVRGTFQWPLERLDIEFLFLDGAVVLYWLMSDNTFVANIFLEIDIWISFAPMIRSTWEDPETEDPKPWLIWSIAYTLLTLVVILRWEKWWDLLLPVNYLVLHLTIWLIARHRDDIRKAFSFGNHHSAIAS